jgi:phosphate transport system substrate-binding protein
MPSWTDESGRDGDRQCHRAWAWAIVGGMTAKIEDIEMKLRKFAAACTASIIATAAGTLFWHEADPVPRPSLASPSKPPIAPELGLTIDNFPRVDGSTSTEPLLVMTACKILGAGYISYHDSQNDSLTLAAVDLATMNEVGSVPCRLCDWINKRMQTHGTGDAYQHLIRKEADLILAARPPSDDEAKLAGELGVTLDVRPVALDAFVFLLNRRNGVSGLTTAQIRDIYSGRIVNWREVGGSDAPIQPYQRTRNSGSQELMQKLVMKDRDMIQAPEFLIGTGMGSPYLALDEDEYGIAYSVYYYHEFMAPPVNIKACAVDGVLPRPRTIRTRRYPFVTEVHVVVRGDLPADHPALRLRDWMLGPAGQGIVAESGYVPIREPSPTGPR